jgi:hypothetical protein
MVFLVKLVSFIGKIGALFDDEILKNISFVTTSIPNYNIGSTRGGSPIGKASSI